MDRLSRIRDMASSALERKAVRQSIGDIARQSVQSAYSAVSQSLDTSRQESDYRMAEWIRAITEARQEPLILEDEPVSTEPFVAPATSSRSVDIQSEFNHEGVSEAAKLAMDRLEELHGQPFTITSAYRDPETNARVGGASGSQHLHGNAFDIDVSHMSIEERVELIRKAQEAGFTGIGVYNNSLHFDVGPARAWGPSYSRDSIPAWARGVLNG